MPEDSLSLTPLAEEATITFAPHVPLVLIPGLLPSADLYPEGGLVCDDELPCDDELIIGSVDAVYPYQGDPGLVLTPLPEVIL